MMEEFCTSIQARTTSAHNDERTLFFSPRLESHPAHNDGRFPHFHLGQNHILLTMMEELCSSTQAGTTSCSQWWKISALTFIKAGTHPTHNDEKALHLHPPMWEHILQQWWKGSALTSTHAGTHPTTMMEGLCTYIHPCRNTFYNNDGRDCTHIWSCRNQSYSHIKMPPNPRPSYLVTNQVPPFS